MASFSAKDVQNLRQSTGVGMLDAKRALEENAGDIEAATRWLREQGLAGAAKREDREATQGAVAVVRDGSVAAIAELRCETDFVAKSAEFVAMTDELAALVAAKGEGSAAEVQDEIDRLRTTLKENISVGQLHRLEAGQDEVVDTYLHQQAGRGVNAVAVVLRNGTEPLAHDVAMHIAFARPQYLRRQDVPESEVAAERSTVEAISRKEGKPEAQLDKIVDGRMNGWFKDRVLMEQTYSGPPRPYIKDDKETIAGLVGSAEIVQFAQVVVGS